MELGLIRKVDIDLEMQQSYLDYAMSVIVARALPDARDGLKPVQRRVLYAMYDLGLRSASSYKKSARIVGEVLGKYHPHGDVAVYESMARLAQDFTMRYNLVDGQGNFGSVDGDPPAAMRYTEARLSPFAMEMLDQLDRDTIDFLPNFDGTLSEPTVLPAAAPNLLVNGASGIAVGMATSIPPHNLGEVIDALSLLLHEWNRLDELTISDLMRFIQGPDFPTGGIILQENGQDELLQAYASGRGRVKVRGRVQKEDMERGKSRLIISELPYQVNKSSLIERIAEMVRENVLEGISDLRDESDRQGMRIVIELKAGVEAEPLLLKLYQRTPLESTFGISLLALVDGEPRLLSLKQALRVYLEHRLVVVRRRSEYDLNKAKARAHILEGLRIALANLDEIIAVIKAAPDVEQARERLIKRFKLSDLQAQAILDMQLRRLASLERKKIEIEYKELLVLIKELQALLKSPERMRQEVETELLAIKEKYADKRRTRIVVLKEGESAKNLLTTNAMTPAQTVWVGVMEDGTIGRAHEDALPRLSGRSAPRWLLRGTTHHTLYLALEDGRAAAVSMEAIPDVEKFADGVPLNKVSPLEANDPLAAVMTLPSAAEIEAGVFMVTVTRLGMVKKSSVEDLTGPSSQRFMLAKVNSGDSLGWVFLTGGSADILMVTANGMAIRFSEQEVRPMGLVAAGVNGIKLAAADQVVGAARLVDGLELLAVASNGKAWRVEAKDFPVQGRYGHGVQLCKLEAGVKLAGILVGKRTQSGLVHFNQAAAKSVRMDEINVGKRGRSGQELLQVKTSDKLIDLTPVQDSLAFWKKSGAGARKRDGSGGGEVEEAVAVMLEDENQVQATLPGFDGPPGAPGQPGPAAKTPRSRAKLTAESTSTVKPAPGKRRKNVTAGTAGSLEPAASAARAKRPDPKSAGATLQPAAAQRQNAAQQAAPPLKKGPEAARPARKKKEEEAPTATNPPARRTKTPPVSTEAAKPVERTKTPAVRPKVSKPDERKKPPAAAKKSPPIETHGWEQVEIGPVDLEPPKKRPRKSK